MYKIALYFLQMWNFIFCSAGQKWLTYHAKGIFNTYLVKWPACNAILNFTLLWSFCACLWSKRRDNPLSSWDKMLYVHNQFFHTRFKANTPKDRVLRTMDNGYLYYNCTSVGRKSDKEMGKVWHFGKHEKCSLHMTEKV